jgi:phosphoglycerate dehydrogenase-like enzyme
MTRVLFHYQAAPALARRLEALERDGLDVRIVAPGDEAALARELPVVEILWHVLAPVNAAFIEAAPRLRMIQKWGVGLNTIDLEPPVPVASGSPTCRAPTAGPWPSSRFS